VLLCRFTWCKIKACLSLLSIYKQRSLKIKHIPAKHRKLFFVFAAKPAFFKNRGGAKLFD
jgi:hypothetical protein